MTFQGQQYPKRRVWPIILIIIGLLGCAGSCVAVGAVTLFNAGSKPSATYNIGQRAADGDLAFTVLSMDCSSSTVGTSLLTRTAQGTFCVFNLNVENIGSKAVTFSDNWQKAYAGDGREYSTDTAATLTVAPTTWLAQINPGSTVTNGAIVFDIPAGVRLSSLVLHDGPFSGGVRIHVA